MRKTELKDSISTRNLCEWISKPEESVWTNYCENKGILTALQNLWFPVENTHTHTHTHTLSLSLSPLSICKSVLHNTSYREGKSHAQLCPTLCNPMDCSLPGTGVGCRSLLQGIFLIQGSNPGPPVLQSDSLPLGHMGEIQPIGSDFLGDPD